MTPRSLVFLVIGSALACSRGICSEKLPKDCAILSSAQAPGMIRQCSRPSPKNVTGFWTPSVGDVLEAEKRLPAFLSRCGHKIDLARTHRQYMGIISAGKKLVYLNALLAEESDLDWRAGAIMVCDGGDAYWGVEFDPADKSFQNLEFNGEA
jgi:hypothetical protein